MLSDFALPVLAEGLLVSSSKYEIFSPSPYSNGYRLRQRVIIMFVYMCVYMSAFFFSSSSSSVSLEEGSSQTCIGAVPRDLSLCDNMSGIWWLLLHSNTVCCTILSVERCSLGNTSLHRDEMTPPLQEYSSVLYYSSNTKLDRFMWYTTFLPPMSANSKIVRYTYVAILVFKWAAKIFIVYLGQIYSNQWTNSCYTDILFKGLGVYRLMWHFSLEY